MKTKYLLVMVVSTLLLTGCTSGQKGLKGDVISVTEDKSVKSDNQLEELYKLLQEDKSGDKKCVKWDGNRASTEEDELDSNDIVDGRSFSSGTKSYRVEKLIECYYPNDYEQVDIDEEYPDNCHFTNGSRDIFVSQIQYSDEIAQFDNDENYREEIINLREDRTKYFKNFKTYIGLKEIDGTKKAGFVLLFESDLADRSYKIEVYGLGNVNSIKAEAISVMNKFDVLWY